MEELQNLQRLHILFVEDDELIRSSMSRIMSKFFKETIICENGKVGLEEYTNNQDKIDLIITDLKMPILNGIDMVEEIRKLNKDIPIYVISGDFKLKKEVLELNIEHFFHKPILLPSIFEKINKDFS